MKTSKNKTPAANKEASSQSGTQQTGQQAAGSTNGTPQAACDESEAEGAEDAVTLIKNDHRKVEELFAQFENSPDDEEKANFARQVCNELIVHAMIEEKLFYPACRKAGVEHDSLDEAQVEHDAAKVLIGDVMMGTPGDEFYDAKVKVLAEYIKHHVGEEEEPENGILAKAQAAGIDMNELGRKLKARKAELMRLVERDELDLPVPRTIRPHFLAGGDNDKESRNMDRYSNMRDRDEQGRFVSDDDDYRGRSQSRSDDRRRTRSRDDDDDYDDRRSPRGGRSGWSGDREGHSEAARRGWEGRRSDDDYDDRRSRRPDYDDDRSRGGGRGWYGDREGHSEASRRGWDERESYRSRSRNDDDDDDRRGSRSSRDHGGWFGDSRGHAEAARRGWEDRGSPRSRDDGDYDDRRRSRSRDDDEGHGGWFGDSRGHAEAARRGWRNRDR